MSATSSADPAHMQDKLLRILWNMSVVFRLHFSSNRVSVYVEIFFLLKERCAEISIEGGLVWAGKCPAVIGEWWHNPLALQILSIFVARRGKIRPSAHFTGRGKTNTTTDYPSAPQQSRIEDRYLKLVRFNKILHSDSCGA